VAAILKQSLTQQSDRVFRYGGEEFALVLPDADLDAAQYVTDQIRQRLMAEAIDHEMSPVNPYITVSIGGISGSLGGTLSMTDYTCLADQALYRAKAAGRNQAQLLTLEESLSLHYP
jgi:diguanylate cyclase (GGDEF)-like protein